MNIFQQMLHCYSADFDITILWGEFTALWVRSNSLNIFPFFFYAAVLMLEQIPKLGNTTSVPNNVGIDHIMVLQKMVQFQRHSTSNLSVKSFFYVKLSKLMLTIAMQPLLSKELTEDIIFMVISCSAALVTQEKAVVEEHLHIILDPLVQVHKLQLDTALQQCTNSTSLSVLLPVLREWFSSAGIVIYCYQLVRYFASVACQV